MTAWEVSEDDVQTVLDRHGYKARTSSEIYEEYIEPELDRIVDGVLYYCNMDAQTISMLDDIENILMEEGVLTGEKLCPEPTEEESYSDADDDDDDDDDETDPWEDDDE